MKIQLTTEQYKKMLEDEHIDIVAGDYGIYIELDCDKNFDYFEIVRSPKAEKYGYAYSFDIDELIKLLPRTPYSSNYDHEDSLCPNCCAHMIYNFEYCPKCGQKLDWSEK